MSEEPREQETVAGVVSGVMAKGAGKWQVLVRPDGSQYDKKLWTKARTVHDAATNLIGMRAVFTCGVSEWTNDEGKPIRSLWIESIGGEGSVPAQRGIERDETRVSIERQTALKAAVEIVAAGAAGWTQGMDIGGTVLTTAKRFADFLDSGLPLGEPPWEG